MIVLLLAITAQLLVAETPRKVRCKIQRTLTECSVRAAAE